MTHGYWYLASAYSQHPRGPEHAFQLASQAAGLLIRHGVSVYSPIAHTHPIALAARLDPLDQVMWQSVDAPLLAAAHGLIVLQDEDGAWRNSVGVKHEFEEAKEAGKPVVFMQMANGVPEELGPAAMVGAPA